jgi:ArsR family transcriptional regulator
MGRSRTESPARRASGWTQEELELARLARGIAHPLRLRILRTLRQRGECVCGDLVEELPRAQSTVSQHLKVLKEAGLIRGEVEPPHVCYCLDDDTVRRLQALVEKL